ncbi:hypothetical protein ACFW9F_30060, partial [Streptomyces sp. NPDC059506]
MESPVQLLNVLEWVHERRTAVSPPAGGAGGDTPAVPAGRRPTEATRSLINKRSCPPNSQCN